MELFAKIVNDFLLLTNSAQSSILDISRGPECASVIKPVDHSLLRHLEQVVEADDHTALQRVRHCNPTYLIWKVAGIPSSFELKENFITFENLHVLML